MKITNRLKFPAAFVAAAKGHIYPKVESRIGATSLLDSPQIRRLTLEHWDELEQDMESMFVAMLGTAWHKYLEDHTPEGIEAEKKWVQTIDGMDVVGVADVVTADSIEDYKLISCWSWIFGEKDKWEKQLNILNYLRYKCDGVETRYLRVHAFVKDWSKFKAMQDADYPQSRYFQVELNLWEYEETERYIRERIALHADPTQKCTDEDKWLRIKNYAVMKKGAKRATRCFDEFGLAEQYIVNNGLTDAYGKGNITIECRKTDPRRCLEFCSCRPFCSYGKALKE